MPLQTVGQSPAALAKALEEEAVSSRRPAFLVVYAGLVKGRSWCSDCLAAEPFLENKFAGRDAKVVYAGSREEWRKPGSPWKLAPFNVAKLPTLLKVTGDGASNHCGHGPAPACADLLQKWHQLVETEVYNQSKLDAFVDSA